MTTNFNDQSKGAAGPLLFPLGKLAATRGALAACSPHYLAYLRRHARGDWGNVSRLQAAINRKAVTQGGRISSAHPIDPAKPRKGSKNTLSIVTEPDRSATTFLLPGEEEIPTGAS